MAMWSTQPTFSVICAAFQAEDTMARAVASVLAQTRGDWELIVCNDGSVDHTARAALAAADGDPRVTVFSQSNAGPAAARNAAAARARGPFLVVLDADDEMLPGYMRSMAALIELAPDRDIYSCNALVRDPDGSESTWLPRGSTPAPVELTLDDMVRRNRIFVMAAVRSSAFERAGGFDPDSAVEDYDLWLRILASGGRHAYTPKVLSVYHRRADAASAYASRQWDATAELLERYARDPALSPHTRTGAERGAKRYRGMAVLSRLAEEPAAASDASSAPLTRRQAYAALAGYEGIVKRAAGAVLVTASPRLFARVAGRRRASSLKRRYGDGGGARP